MARVEQLSSLQNSRLRAACDELLLQFKTQDALAEALKITPGALSQFLRAKTGASATLGKKIADLAGLPADRLLWGDTEQDVFDLAEVDMKARNALLAVVDLFIDTRADLEALISAALRARLARQRSDATLKEPHFTAGERVHHDTFGGGDIINIQDTFMNQGQHERRVTVSFDHGIEIIEDENDLQPLKTLPDGPLAPLTPAAAEAFSNKMKPMVEKVDRFLKKAQQATSPAEQAPALQLTTATGEIVVAGEDGPPTNMSPEQAAAAIYDTEPASSSEKTGSVSKAKKRV